MTWSTEFETGLLDDFDFTITSAFFAPDAKYNNGETTLLQWEGTTDNVDQPETHVWFPLGKGWVSKDGGKTIVHESGKPDKYFVKTSLMARLIERCVKDFGMGDVLAQRGDPFHSEPWIGMKFHMKSETIDFGGGGSSNIDPKAKVFPVQFLGVVGGAAASATSSAPAGPTAAEKIAAARAKAAGAAAGGSLKEQVVALFTAETDFAAAQDKALAIPGVAEDATGLLDSILFDGPGSLWAEVKGS